MGSKNIIIVLIVVIAILLATIGFALLNPSNPKDPTIVRITSDKK